MTQHVVAGPNLLTSTVNNWGQTPLIHGSTCEVTQCLNLRALGSLLASTRAYRPDSLMKVVLLL